MNELEKRMNLRELRDNLNKLSDVYLENTKLVWNWAMSDDPSDDFNFMTLFDDDAEEKDQFDRFEMYETKAFKDLQKRFLKPLNKDLEQARIREGEKGYDDEYNSLGEE